MNRWPICVYYNGIKMTFYFLFLNKNKILNLTNVITKIVNSESKVHIQNFKLKVESNKLVDKVTSLFIL